MKFKSFDKFATLEQFVKTAITTPRNNESSGRQSEENGKSFCGTENMAESVAIAKKGYQLDKISAELSNIKSAEKYELKQAWSVSGSDVDMGLYMEDVPECMIDFEVMEAKKFVNLVIGVVEGAGIKAKCIMNRAIAVCSIVDKLESDNYRVQLSMAICNTRFKEGVPNITLIDIKRYEQPMSIARLAGVLHTGFYRRIIFRYWEGHRDFTAFSGYGRCGSDRDAKDGLKQSGFITDDFVYLPAITEWSGGSLSNTLHEEFDKVHDAVAYADDVHKRIEELTVKV